MSVNYAASSEETKPPSYLTKQQYIILMALRLNNQMGLNWLANAVEEEMGLHAPAHNILQDLTYLAGINMVLVERSTAPYPPTYFILKAGIEHLDKYRPSREYVLMAADFSAPTPYLHIGPVTIYWARLFRFRDRFGYWKSIPSRDKMRWWRDWHIVRRWKE